MTFKMQQRRFTRLTNGFSKKLENHKAAVAPFVAHYNLCRIHETLRVIPAMGLGITDHVWTVDELISATENPERFAPIDRPTAAGTFRVIDGGRA